MRACRSTRARAPCFGLRQPAAAQLLGRNVRQVRFDVEHRRAVEHVDPRDAQRAAVTADQFDDGQADWIGTLR